MAMDWLKGLVGPVAQFSPQGQPVPPGGSPAYPPAYGAPAPGAPPPGAWGPPGGADPSSPPIGGGTGWTPADPAYGAPGAGAPPAYSVPGPYGAQSHNAQPAFNAPAPAGAPSGNADARIAQLEDRCEALRRDLESVALFAQALLAVLEDRKVMTQQDFQDMRRKLDLLDGRLDDRIGKPG